jgi:hypothetical protein
MSTAQETRYGWLRVVDAEEARRRAAVWEFERAEALREMRRRRFELWACMATWTIAGIGLALIAALGL